MDAGGRGWTQEDAGGRGRTRESATTRRSPGDGGRPRDASLRRAETDDPQVRWLIQSNENDKRLASTTAAAWQRDGVTGRCLRTLDRDALEKLGLERVSVQLRLLDSLDGFLTTHGCLTWAEVLGKVGELAAIHASFESSQMTAGRGTLEALDAIAPSRNDALLEHRLRRPGFIKKEKTVVARGPSGKF